MRSKKMQLFMSFQNYLNDLPKGLNDLPIDLKAQYTCPQIRIFFYSKLIDISQVPCEVLEMTLSYGETLSFGYSS